jgi:glyoxylase-like metal-dependent hydrolase (beta-lactamase superfamily II)
VSPLGPFPLPVAARWFERKRIDDAVTLLWEPHVDPLIRCNIWHVRGSDRDLLVDSGLGIASLRSAARDLFERPVTGVATHYHYDHSGGMLALGPGDQRLIHPREAPIAAAGTAWGSLLLSDMPDLDENLAAWGYDCPPVLVDAVPHEGYDIDTYAPPAWTPTGTIDEGAIVDLGDRAFEVLHLPGHSPGSIGLWDADTGTLFSGDAVYDGPLLDQLPDSDLAAYVRTMERLVALAPAVSVVHAGHEPSFDGPHLTTLCTSYLSSNAADADR